MAMTTKNQVTWQFHHAERHRAMPEALQSPNATGTPLQHRYVTLGRSTATGRAPAQPQPEEHRMSRARTITVTVGSLAAGAILATGITGIASAANGTTSPEASTGTSQTAPGHQQRGGPDGGPAGGPAGGRHEGPRGAMLGGPRGEALHAEAVVKAADGTISTVSQIQGTVTAVAASAITVKAEDGFTATYVVNDTTEVRTGLPPQRPDLQGATGTQAKPTAPAAGSISDVKVGDVARVEGTVSGSTSTATEVHSMTAAQKAQLDQQRAQHDQSRQQSGSSSTTPSPSSAA
jgi:hypothetical protein